MKIEKLIPNPGKPHAPFVRLILDNGEAVEFTVRDDHMKTLATAAKRLAYVLECKEYHSPEGPDGATRAKARRAQWDADDKARADAAESAAKAAELAKFIVTPQGFVTDKEGAIVGVRVTVTHQGHTASVVIPNDPANTEANARTAWQASKDAADAVQVSLNAFAVSV